MLSIQEMLNKTEDQRRDIKRSMEANGFWHSEDANIFQGQKRSIQRELSESLRKIPLREFLSKTTTAAIGSTHLVPDKLHSLLIHSAKRFDIVPLISMRVIDGWEGGDLKVDIGLDDSYVPHEVSGGGSTPTQTIATTYATISPKLFNISARILSEMVDDSQWDLIEWHVEQAGKRMGKFSSDLAIAVLEAGADGDGALNTVTAGAAFTTPAHIHECVDENGRDEWISNTMLITPEAWEHSIVGVEVAGGAAGDVWRCLDGVNVGLASEGYDLRFHTLDTLFCTSKHLHAAADLAGAAFTECDTVVFDRFNALLTGRKRWLQIDNYANPVEDLAGAVVSARQDSVTIYNDSICVATET